LEPTAKAVGFDAHYGVRFGIIPRSSSEKLDAKERFLEALQLALLQSIDKEHEEFPLLMREAKSFASANLPQFGVD
jgi:hypothetical protein